MNHGQTSKRTAFTTVSVVQKKGAIQRHQEATGYDGTQHYEGQMQEALDRKAAAEARYQAAL